MSLTVNVGPVRAASLRPATVAMLLGAALGIVSFGLGIAMAALLFRAVSRGYFLFALIAAAVVMAVIGAIFGWAVWRTAIDRVDWPRVESEHRRTRSGVLGRTRARARRGLDRRSH